MSKTPTIPSSAAQAVHRANAVTGECAFWDERSGFVWWIDIQGQRVLGYAPATGEERAFNTPSMPGMLAGRRKGGMLVGLEDGIHEFDPATGLGAHLVAVEADNPLTRVNDGKPDSTGRLWFGTMDKSGRAQPFGSLYRLDTDLRLTRVRENVAVPNGIAFSPDCRRMYFADSITHTIEAIDYDPATGELGTSRVFVKYPGELLPDGTCVDTDGALWVAVVEGGRIERRLPDGTLDRIVEVPVSRPTMPEIGGPDGETLFLTSQRRVLSRDKLRTETLAGDLLSVRIGQRAPAPHRVAF
ncbi:MAG: SMP-30/gluconolactonase/LRE family protein [Alphaproteobacteria bacterium]|nr:SMP-30/gluconolactonase/LRE family protein [Alphaproteobacteria bacterium]MCA0452006.1 SMP-30/gluconolactonase/LRE family protein [Pseudomonadota bacterium]